MRIAAETDGSTFDLGVNPDADTIDYGRMSSTSEPTVIQKNETVVISGQEVQAPRNTRVEEISDWMARIARDLCDIGRIHPEARELVIEMGEHLDRTLPQ